MWAASATTSQHRARRRGHHVDHRGHGPVHGRYLPEGNLTLLENKSLAGTWKLEVKDDARLITGQLLDWSITARYTSATASGPQVVVTPTSGLVTTEAGGTATFTVRLDNAPTADVTIPVSSSDMTEGTVSYRAWSSHPPTGTWPKPSR